MITLKTYNGQNINPADDAILYDKIIGASGIISGCEITHLGANQLKIASGRMIIKGRTVTITEQTIYATLSTSGTISGRLLVHMDLSNTEEPIAFLTQAGASLPELVQNEDCNYENGVYELPLATYIVNESVIGIDSLFAIRPTINRSIENMVTTEAFNNEMAVLNNAIIQANANTATVHSKAITPCLVTTLTQDNITINVGNNYESTFNIGTRDNYLPYPLEALIENASSSGVGKSFCMPYGLSINGTTAYYGVRNLGTNTAKVQMLLRILWIRVA